MQLVPIPQNERQIFDAKCRVTTGHRGIEFIEDLNFDEWQGLLNGFVRAEGVIQFIIGDLLAYGASKYERGKYDAALAATGRSYKTLANWCSLCTQIPPSERIYDLSYSHYVEVGHLQDKEARNRLLSLAEEDDCAVIFLRKERQKLQSVGINTGKFGAPISVSGLCHAPINEQGVVFLFGLLSKELGFSVDAIQQAFPDCLAKRKVAERRTDEWGIVRIEFEFLSSEFRRHKHDATQCDLIVCWQHDWPECPIEVLELKGWIEEKSSQ